MKRNLIVTLMLLLTSTIVFAQKKHEKGKHGDNQVEKMKTELSLSDAQYASIKNINTKYKDKHVALRGDSTLKGDAKTDKMKSLHDERQKEIQKVLTPEQRTKWKAVKEKQAEEKKAKRAERKAAHDAELKSRLSLTDEQFTKFDAANKTFKEKSREAHKSKKDKSEIKKLAEEHDASVQAILSDAQYQQWKAYQAEKKEAMKGKRKHGKK